MSGHADLVAAMKDCRAQGSMRSLYVYRDRVRGDPMRAREVQEADRVITLLKLPKQTPSE